MAPPKVQLTVWQVHMDADFPPASITFALGLVCAPFRRVLEGTVPSARSPLARAIDIEAGQDGDETWMMENARAFIASVSRKGVKNARANMRTVDYEDLASLPQAVLDVVATDPAWVAHLKPGLSWRTATYDMGKAKPKAALHPGNKESSKPSKSSKPAPSPPRKASKTKEPSPRRASVGSRRFEFNRGVSKKFWEVELQGKSLITRYGRIGSAARETKKPFASAADAKSALSKLVAEKSAKGYREV